MRDIHEPAEPGWWLLAPGYLWLCLGMAGLLGISWLVLRRRRSERLAKLAAGELRAIRADYQDDQDCRRFALRVSRWLKQVALIGFPAEQLQSASGERWLKFLDQDLDDKPFSRGCGRIFGAAVYARQVDIDADEIIRLCERWLQRARPRLQQRGIPR